VNRTDFPTRPLPRRRPTTVKTVAGLFAVVGVAMVAQALLVAWLLMLLLGILGLAVGFGTSLVVSFVGSLIVGLLRS